MRAATLALLTLISAAPAWAGDSTAEPAAYAAALAPMLEATAVRRSRCGVHVADTTDDQSLFGRGADTMLVPASAMKLLTSAAAFDVLGPSHVFTTDVYADGEVRGGVLEGSLFIKGHGDPTLTAERLWGLLRDLRTLGIREVAGDVVLDDTYFSEGPRIPGWDNDVDEEEGPSYYPSIGALGLGFGSVTVVVRPAGEAGKKADVFLELAAGDVVQVTSSVATGSERSRTRLEFERAVQGSTLRLDVKGTIAAGRAPFRERRSVPDPTAYFGGVLAGLMDDVGIKVKGRTRRGEVVEGADRLARLYSPPLASVLMDTNKYSSNWMAELVLRTLGAEAGGAGSTEAGLAVVRGFLRRIGVPDDEVTMANGSGLSRQTLMTPTVLTTVLGAMARNRLVGWEFVSSLSIGGADGTLRRRLTDVTGQVRGKTGTLSGVHALAGYALGPRHQLLAFAFLCNGVRGSLYPIKAAQDDFLRAVMTVGPVSGVEE